MPSPSRRTTGRARDGPSGARVRASKAYVRHRLTNGVVEGINDRLRMVARRAFGFHSPGALIAMIHLCADHVPSTHPSRYPPNPEEWP
ncbi:MAG: transposase [Myxococcota bacterium]